MNKRPILKTWVWLILLFGILLVLISTLITVLTVSNILLGLGTGVVTSFTVAIIIEYRHEKHKRSFNEDLRKDFFNSLSHIIKDLFFIFRSNKFACSKLSTEEYLDYISSNISQDNFFLINHTTLHTLRAELEFQNINTGLLRVMAIITEEEERNVNNFISRIRKLNERSSAAYIDLIALFATLKNDILIIPEFHDFLYLNFSFSRDNCYTVINIDENYDNADRIKSSDILEPLFR